jgi:hypothetical protein
MVKRILDPCTRCSGVTGEGLPVDCSTCLPKQAEMKVLAEEMAMLLHILPAGSLISVGKVDYGTLEDKR